MRVDDPRWWGDRWRPDPGGLTLMDAPRMLVSPLVPAALLRRCRDAGARVGLTVGPHSLWEPADVVVWAQPNLLGVIETPPPLPADRQLVAIDPMLAPLVEDASVAVWSPRGPVRLTDGERGPVEAARRAVAAGAWLRGAASALPAVRALEGVRRVTLMLEDGGRAPLTEVAATTGIDVRGDPVPGLPGAVTLGPGPEHGRGILARALELVSGHPVEAGQGPLPPRTPPPIPVP